MQEQYTPGYSVLAVQYMKRRHAQRDAQFFLPHLRSGWSLLDCGCGPGTITSGLAQAILPGTVIAVDVGYSQVCLAKECARAAECPNIRAATASIYRLPFRSRTFHAVFSHALFEHLDDPLEGLREIRRVLQPGGVVGLSSPDWHGSLIAPPDKAVQATVHQFTSLQIANGGNPYAGAELGKWLEATGFVAIRLSARYDCYEDPALIIRLMAERIAGQDLSPALPAPAPVNDILAEATEWSRQPAALFAQAFVEAIAFAPN